MLETDSTSYLYVSQEVKMRADHLQPVTLAKIKIFFFAIWMSFAMAEE